MLRGFKEMKKILKCFLLVFVCLFMCLITTACSSDASITKINLDLVSGGDDFARVTIGKIDNAPSSYNGKTIKVRGKFQGSSSYYYLQENNTCCNWTFEIKFDEDLKIPSTGTNITITGHCRSEKSKSTGKTSWWVDVSEYKK